MSKICSNCQAENRDDAQFCRACGTPFTAAPPPPDASAGRTCFECGFANKPGVRYCAKCGVNLMGSVVAPRSEAQAPVAAAAPDYPPPFDPLPAPDYPPLSDPMTVAYVPHPRVAIDVERDLGNTSLPASVGFGITPPPAASNRTPLWAGLGIAVLVAAGVAWWFLNTSPTPPPPATAPPIPAPTAAPEPRPTPKTAEGAPAEPMTTAAPTASADALPSAPMPSAVAPPLAPLPGTAEAASKTPDAEPAGAEAEAQRLAAEKTLRDKAARAKSARDKADREAKAKAMNEQRELAAHQKAEEDAARKRVEEQRVRSQPVSPLVTAPVARPAPGPQMRTVKEICAGRNLISQAICESRECGATEHANEAICKQVSAAQERRSGQN